MIKLMENDMGDRIPLKELHHEGVGYSSMDLLKKAILVHPLELNMLVRVKTMKPHSTLVS